MKLLISLSALGLALIGGASASGDGNLRQRVSAEQPPQETRNLQATGANPTPWYYTDAAAYCATFSDVSIPYHIVERASGNVIAATTAGTGNTDLPLNATTTEAQWTFVQVTPFLYNVINSNGRKMAIDQNSTEDGADVVLIPADEASVSDLWCFRDYYGDAYFQVINANSGWGIAINPGEVIQEGITGAYNGKFRVVPVANPRCGVFGHDYITNFHVLHTYMTIGINAEQYENNGAPVEMNNIFGEGLGVEDGHKWQMKWVGPGIYEFHNIATGQLMNIAGNSYEYGAAVIQWPRENNNQQNYRFCLLDDDRDNYYELMAMHSTNVVDVAAASEEPGAITVQWEANGQDNQEYEPLPAYTRGCVRFRDPELFAWHIVARHSNKAISADPAAPMTQGSGVVQMDINFTSSMDDWRVMTLGHDQSKYHIFNVNSGLSLNVAGNNNDDGAAVVQWPLAEGQLNDDFCLVEAGEGYYEIVAQHSQDRIDIGGNSTDDGAPALQWPATGGLNQQWKLIPVLPPCEIIPDTNRTVHIVARHSNKALSPDAEADPEGLIVQNPASELSGLDNWRLEGPFNGFYRAINQVTGLALQVGNAGLDNGAIVVEGPTPTATGNDLLCVHSVRGEGNEGFYKLGFQHSGYFLTVDDGSQEDGAPTVHSRRTGEENQQYSFVTTMGAIPGASLAPSTSLAPSAASACTTLDTEVLVYIIAEHSGKAIHANDEIDAPIYQAPADLTYDGNHFLFRESESPGYYHVMETLADDVFNIEGASEEAGARIIRFPPQDEASNDNWCFVDQGGGLYSILSEFTGFAISVIDGSFADNANYAQMPYMGLPSQRFFLIPYDIAGPAPLPFALPTTAPSDPIATNATSTAPSMAPVSATTPTNATAAASATPSTSPSMGGCHNTTECAGPNELCFAQDDSFCGICGPGQSCSVDGDCLGGTQVCDDRRLTCQCNGGGTYCNAPCTSNTDCGLGDTCTASGHCVLTNCTTDAECIDHYACGIGATCDRRSCSIDSDCAADNGFCVKGKCYEVLGFCSPPPP